MPENTIVSQREKSLVKKNLFLLYRNVPICYYSLCFSCVRLSPIRFAQQRRGNYVLKASLLNNNHHFLLIIIFLCVSCVPSLSAMLSRSLSEQRISLHLLSFACLCFSKGERSRLLSFQRLFNNVFFFCLYDQSR